MTAAGCERIAYVTAQELLPGYLLVGSDEYRRSEYVSRLKAHLEQTGMADFNLDERDMNRDPQIDDIIASLNTLPMGTEFRLVILYGCDKLPKTVSEPLVEYFSAPSPSTVCLVIADRLPKSTRLYKAVAKLGAKAAIDCSPMKARELSGYLCKIAPRYNGRINPVAAEELVSRVGENTRLLVSELQKLIEIAQVPMIEKEHVERYVVRTAEAKPWDLLNAIASRNASSVLEQLSLQPARSEIRIEKEHVERYVVRTAEAKPWDLLNAIASRNASSVLEQLSLQPARSEIRTFTLIVGRLRELIIAKALDARGEGGRLAEVLGLQSWQVKNHVKWSRKFSMLELTSALHDAVDVEMALKGSRDSELALRIWVMGLVGGDSSAGASLGTKPPYRSR